MATEPPNVVIIEVNMMLNVDFLVAFLTFHATPDFPIRRERSIKRQQAEVKVWIMFSFQRRYT